LGFPFHFQIRWGAFLPFPKPADVYEDGTLVTAKLLACAFPQEIPSGTIKIAAPGISQK
jgi:hypothetical protein